MKKTKPIRRRSRKIPSSITLELKSKIDDDRGKGYHYLTGTVSPSRRREFDVINYIEYLYDQVILKPNRKYIMIIDYPLSVPYKEEISTGKNGMKISEVIDLGVKAYHKIYNEERKSSSLKEESIQKRTKGKSLLINRAETNGRYGIWGHDLSDLAIVGVSVVGNKIYFSVDS